MERVAEWEAALKRRDFSNVALEAAARADALEAASSTAEASASPVSGAEGSGGFFGGGAGGGRRGRRRRPPPLLGRQDRTHQDDAARRCFRREARRDAAGEGEEAVMQVDRRGASE